VGEAAGEDEEKEAEFWRPIYQRSNEQDKMKKGDFETSKLDRQ